jgi:hypothetical protein
LPSTKKLEFSMRIINEMAQMSFVARRLAKARIPSANRAVVAAHLRRHLITTGLGFDNPDHPVRWEGFDRAGVPKGITTTLRTVALMLTDGRDRSRIPQQQQQLLAKLPGALRCGPWDAIAKMAKRWRKRRCRDGRAAAQRSDRARPWQIELLFGEWTARRLTSVAALADAGRTLSNCLANKGDRRIYEAQLRDASHEFLALYQGDTMHALLSIEVTTSTIVETGGVDPWGGCFYEVLGELIAERGLRVGECRALQALGLFDDSPDRGDPDWQGTIGATSAKVWIGNGAVLAAFDDGNDPDAWMRFTRDDTGRILPDAVDGRAAGLECDLLLALDKATRAKVISALAQPRSPD